MPILENLRKKKQIKLPKSGGVVYVWDEILAGDLRQTLTPGINETEASFKILVKLIAEWDFTDTEGNVLPVNEDTLDKLPMSDLTVLSQHIQEMVQSGTINETLKKNTNNNST